MRAILIIFLCSAVIRGIYLWQDSRSPVFLTPIVDSATYDAQAREIAAGVLPQSLFWQPVFYPLFLGGVYALSGGSIWCAKIIQILLGSLTCVLVYLLARRVYDNRVGYVAGGLAASYGTLVFFDAELLGTVWACFWAAALLNVLLWAKENPRPPRVWCLGGVAGASIVCRPTFLFVLFVLVMWMAWSDMRARSGQVFSRVARLLGGGAVVVVPIGLLAFVLTGTFTFLPRSAGLNLYLGNNPDVRATLTARPGWNWDELTRMPLHHGILRRSETNAFFRKQAVDYALGQPVSCAVNMAHKTLQLVSSRELPRNTDPYLHRRWSTLLALLMGRLGPWGWPLGVFLPLVAVGVMARPGPARPLLLCAGAYALGVVTVFVTARYRMPVIVMLCPVAGAGVCAVVDWCRARNVARIGLCILVSAPVLAVSTLPGPFAQEGTNYTAEMYYILGSLARDDDRLDDAEELLRAALDLEPDYPDGLNGLATVYERQGRLPEAVTRYARALSINPDHGTAQINLARALVQSPKPELAEPHFQAAARILPWDAGVHTSYAIYLSNAGRPADALSHFESACRLAPKDPDKLSNMGGVLRELGRNDEAIDYFEAALAIRNDHYPAALNLITLLREMGEHDRAQGAYARIIRVARAAGHTEFADRVMRATNSP